MISKLYSLPFVSFLLDSISRFNSSKSIYLSANLTLLIVRIQLLYTLRKQFNALSIISLGDDPKGQIGFVEITRSLLGNRINYFH